MKKTLLLSSFIFLSISLFAQVKTLDENATLFTVSGNPTSVKEFTYVYQKNNIDGSADFSKQSIENYLQLFINYKLKVQEAKDLGLDTIAALEDEYKGYKRQLLENHIQRQILDPLVKQEYERMQKDVSVSHIFVDKKTANAKTKIEDIFNKLKKGSDFEKLAKDFSEDQPSASNGGFMGYFTAMQIGFPQIEDAVYSTPVGGYSNIIETDLGYHIIKVNDVRSAFGTIKVAMIKLNFKDEEEADKAKIRIDSIYQRVKEGGDFADLAMKYSDDKNSAMKGGELEWFGINTYIPKFEEVAFGLKENRDVSVPFKSNTAWYIIKRLVKVEKQDFDEYEPVLKNKILHSRIYEAAAKEFNNKLEKMAEYIPNQENMSLYLNALDTLANQKTFVYSKEEKPYSVVKIAGQDISQIQFSEIISKLFPTVINIQPQQKPEKLLNMAIHELLLHNYESKLIDSLYEYRELLEEYKNGVLIFELTKEKLWDKAANDSLGLILFYNQLGDKYMWNERARVVDIEPKTSITLKNLEKLVKKNKLNTKEEWDAFLKKNNHYNIDLKEQTLEKNVSDTWNKIQWAAGLYMNADGSFYQVTEILPRQRKDISEVKGYVVSAYQKELEQEWLKQLHEKYVVKIDKNVLNNLEKKTN
ncbi:MAG: peptidylprolyl isomerase [Chitinophagales bacterium]|nr:peptidylprolyl isomerase [Chitinophagales bacterium]